MKVKDSQSRRIRYCEKSGENSLNEESMFYSYVHDLAEHDTCNVPEIVIDTYQQLGQG